MRIGAQTYLWLTRFRELCWRYLHYVFCSDFFVYFAKFLVLNVFNPYKIALILVFCFILCFKGLPIHADSRDNP